MSDKLEGLSVYNAPKALSAVDTITSCSEDNSNDSFHIPSLPIASSFKKTYHQTCTEKKRRSQDIAEERKVIIAPPVTNIFITETSPAAPLHLHYHAGKKSRRGTALWLTAYKDRPRLVTDFDVEDMIGEGTFSNVYAARNRVDGMLYALKKLKTPFPSFLSSSDTNEEDDEQNYKRSVALNEVCALAALSHCPSIVRYYSSWLEDGYLYIQTELCLPKSLDLFVKSPLPSFIRTPLGNGGGNSSNHDSTHSGISESFGWRILVVIAEALKCMHAHNMVHLDIRPSNVFISPQPHPSSVFTVSTLPPTVAASQEDNMNFFSQNENSQKPGDRAALLLSVAASFTPVHEEKVVSAADVESNVISGRWSLKVGDLGLSRRSLDVRGVEEGEIRYCAPELITRGSGAPAIPSPASLLTLPACDIFSAGATLYELCKGSKLEQNTNEWHNIRNNLLNEDILASYSIPFTALLKQVISFVDIALFARTLVNKSFPCRCRCCRDNLV